MTKQLFVGNLGASVTKEDLSTAFAVYSPLDCSVQTRRENTILFLARKSGGLKNLGFGFVTISDDVAEDCVNALNGLELDGRAIRVEIAKEKTPKPPRESPKQRPRLADTKALSSESLGSPEQSSDTLLSKSDSQSLEVMLSKSDSQGDPARLPFDPSAEKKRSGGRRRPRKAVAYIGHEFPNSLPFCAAARVGSMLYLSGTLGTDQDIKLVPGSLPLTSGGIKAETRQAMENIKSVLERSGSSLDLVVKMTIMLSDIANEWAAMNEVCPARSSFGTAGLALGARVEIECIAVLRKEDK